MKASLFSIILAACVSIQIDVFSQPVHLDSLQIERVAKTCQLWGHIKYFHPYLSGPSVDWENAFSANIEKIIQSKTRTDYERSIQMMLDQLHDPATHVVKQSSMNDDEDTVKYPIIEFIQDSMLLIAVRDYRDLEDFDYVGQKIASLHKLIPMTKGIVFDFRGSSDVGDLRGYLSYYFKEIERDLVAKELKMPELRARYHDGFVPETGQSSGGYNTGFYTKDEKSITPMAGNGERPIVFIVNEYAEIPLSALAMQHAGTAKILTTDILHDASFVDAFNFQLDDSIAVNIRLNVLPSDLTTKADYSFPANTDEETIMRTALQILKGQKMNDTTIQTSESNAPATVEEKNNQNTFYPDLGQRLLAAAKIWTVIHYFFAYQDLMEDDWDDVLRQFIPRFASAKDSLEYTLAVAEMYTHIQDGHGFIRSLVLRNYFGTATPPIAIRFIENQPVVTAIFPDSIYEVRGIEVGDVVVEIDGETAAARTKRMSEYTCSSNPSALLNYISWRFLNGQDSTEVNLKIKKKNGSVSNITLPRYEHYYQYMETFGNERSQTPVTRLINKDVGYADLDRLTSDMVDQMFIDFKDTKAIIFDMRGYPHGTAWSISPHLTDKKDLYAANFRRYSPMSIQDGSSKHMTFFDQAIPPPQLPTYHGKTVMLIDERTQSQAEHTGLFFEAANGTKFIGSQTAGANGDVTNFQIPGNIILSFSGHDVRHIDGRQLQRIGLVPDVSVKPTITGIRKNKDEVLEKAIKYLKKS